jgi:hypothetical protein
MTPRQTSFLIHSLKNKSEIGKKKFSILPIAEISRSGTNNKYRPGLLRRSETLQLEGSISLQRFKSRLHELSGDQEIILIAPVQMQPLLSEKQKIISVKAIAVSKRLGAVLMSA